jgi:hypothetical protein
VKGRQLTVAQRIHHVLRDRVLSEQPLSGACLVEGTITRHSVISKKATGVVVSGFRVEVAEVTDEEMAGRRCDHPEAFNRDYDASTGVSLSGRLRQ